jgi:hypothetical protein
MMGPVLNTCSGTCDPTSDARMQVLGQTIRVALRSAAFAECMNRAVRRGIPETQTIVQNDNPGCNPNPNYDQVNYGPYVSCRPGWDASQGGTQEGGTLEHDPAWNETVDRQLSRALNSLLTDFGVRQEFDVLGGPDPGSHQSGLDFGFTAADYGPIDTLGVISDQAGWFGTAIHEALHNWGYDHGCRAAPPATDHGNCSRSPQTWAPARAMNNLAGFCVAEVILRSTNTSASNAGCGTQGSGTSQTLIPCTEAGYMIVSSFASSSATPVTCQCVPDSLGLSWNESDDDFGAAVAVGDFNNDGWDDLAVGAPGKPGGGLVVTFRGSKMGLRHWQSMTAAADLSLGGSSVPARCGAALAAGDFDGNGLDDLAIGCPGWGNQGRVAVVPSFNVGLGEQGLQPAVASVLAPTFPGEFGFSLATGRISGGDSLDDLAVGGPSANGHGRVDVYRGNSSLPPVSWVFAVGGGATGNRFGHAVAFGNVQANSTDELIVGVPGANSSRGLVYVVSGPGGSLSLLPAPTLPANAQFGAALTAGDVVSDTYEDIFISAPGISNLYQSNGASSAPSAATFASGTLAPADALAFVPGSPKGGLLTGHSTTPAAERWKSTGNGVAMVEGVGGAWDRPLWSLPSSQEGPFGHCLGYNAPDDPTANRFCAIDSVSFTASRAGKALAVGNFGNGIQFVVGAPDDTVGSVSPTPGGAVYVRRGEERFYAAEGDLVEPLEYRLDQVSTFYGGVKDDRDFGAASTWHGSFCFPWEPCLTGNVDGDADDDVLAFAQGAADVYVARSDGASAFGAVELWHSDICGSNQVCAVGDVDANGTDDIIAFVQGAMTGHINHVHVVRSKNGPLEEWSSTFCVNGEICRVADVNGDGRADVVAFNRSSGNVWVNLSTGASFAGAGIWHNSFCIGSEECHVGDVDGDGKADIIKFLKGSSGDAYISRSTGTVFGNPAHTSELWHEWLCVGSGSTAEECRVGDLNGDGLADVAVFVRDANTGLLGDVWATLSNKNDFSAGDRWHTDLCRGTQNCQLGDVDGDTRSDAVVFTHNTDGLGYRVRVALSKP